jgi:hypothetical protein
VAHSLSLVFFHWLISRHLSCSSGSSLSPTPFQWLVNYHLSCSSGSLMITYLVPVSHPYHIPLSSGSIIITYLVPVAHFLSVRVQPLRVLRTSNTQSPQDAERPITPIQVRMLTVCDTPLINTLTPSVPVAARSKALACCDHGFESHRVHGYLPIVCCQVEVSATS